MTRGIGEAEVASGLPKAVTAVAGLATQLGDMWFVLVGICLLYVLARRGYAVTDEPSRACAYLFALTIGAYSLTVILKHTFALPRPPGAAIATPPSWIPAIANGVYESATTGDGYGFPSGHALKTVAVYGGGAFALDVWDRNRRLAVAGALSAVVAASRVVLGVHYAVDVVVGAVVGAVFLAGAIRLTDQRPTRALALSTVVGVLAFAATGTHNSGLALLAVGVGLTVWVATGRSRRLRADATGS